MIFGEISPKMTNRNPNFGSISPLRDAFATELKKEIMTGFEP
jgi:hypothetical protein|tara:strand:+ start:263 stop:388 length:126 start_codon:yes stop_codon:yes gene_type:complete